MASAQHGSAGNNVNHSHTFQVAWVDWWRSSPVSSKLATLGIVLDLFMGVFALVTRQAGPVSCKWLDAANTGDKICIQSSGLWLGAWSLTKSTFELAVAYKYFQKHGNIGSVAKALSTVTKEYVERPRGPGCIACIRWCCKTLSRGFASSIYMGLGQIGPMAAELTTLCRGSHETCVHSPFWHTGASLMAGFSTALMTIFYVLGPFCNCTYAVTFLVSQVVGGIVSGIVYHNQYGIVGLLMLVHPGLEMFDMLAGVYRECGPS